MVGRVTHTPRRAAAACCSAPMPGGACKTAGRVGRTDYHPSPRLPVPLKPLQRLVPSPPPLPTPCDPWGCPPCLPAVVDRTGSAEPARQGVPVATRAPHRYHGGHRVAVVQPG